MKLSIIVVAYNVDPYLEACLDSCMFGEVFDYEVLVIVNRSTDRTLAVAQSFAGRHPQLFKIFDMDENIGLGAARNLGMAHATGEYVMFLDGDDWYAPAAGKSIKTILETVSFDMCIFDHVRVYEDGRVTSNPKFKTFKEGLLVAEKDKAAIIQNLGAAWNKIVRRDFLMHGCFSFADGFYEDVDWNFMTQIASQRTYVHTSVLINYRQRKTSILHTRDARHVDVLLRYKRLVYFLRSHPEVARHYGRAIHCYCLENIQAILTKRRLPASEHFKFMRNSSKVLRDLRRLSVGAGLSLKEVALFTGYRKLFLRVCQHIATANKKNLAKHSAQ